MPVSTFASTFGQVANERTLGLGLYQPPITPTITRPWFSISNPGGLTGFERTQNEIVGHPFDAHRLFSDSFVPNPTSILQPEINAGRIPIYSNKPPTSSPVSNYATLKANLAALGSLILMTVDHEPENSMSAAQFEDGYMDLWNAMVDVPNVWVGPIYMAVTFNPNASPDRGPFRDLLDTMPMDFLGVDGYSSQNRRSFEQIFDRVAVQARSRNVPWIIAEWSAHGTPTQRAAHVASGRAYWEDPVNADLLIVSWFDSDGGNQAGPSGWRMERALPDDWAVIGGVARAVNPPPEYVEDLLTPAAIYDALQTKRRNVGPVAPPPPPPVPLQRGCVPVGEADYPVPPGAIFVAVGGSDGSGGLVGTPKATIAGAAATAPDGGTIVLRAGTYRMSTSLPGSKSLTIQNYPNEAVWLVGSDVVTGWNQDNTGPGGTDRWKRINWTSTFSRTPAGDPADASYPEAIWPEQIWIDGVPLEQVSTLADVGTTVTEPGAPGTFWYDATLHRLWIGATPFNKTVTVAARQVAIACSQTPSTAPPKLTLRGVGIEDFATSPSQRGAVQIFGDGSLVENCHIRYCSASGVFVSGAANVTLRLTTFEGNGQLGYRAFRCPDLLVEQCLALRNNRKRFATTGAAGGGKIDTDCTGVIVRNNYGEGNWGHCFWVDLYSHGSEIVGNEVLDHTLGAGLFFEMSNGVVIAGNWVSGCVHGILVSEAGSADVWNNTLISNTNPLIYQLGERADHRRFTARNNLISQRVNDSTQTIYTGVDTIGDVRDWIEQEWSVDNNAVWLKFSQHYARLSVPGNTRTVFDTRAALLTATDGLDDATVVTSGGSVDPYLNSDDKSPKPAATGTGIAPPLSVKDAMVAAGIWTSTRANQPMNIGAF